MQSINEERFLKTFFDFVKIPSESPNDEEFIAYLEDFFKKLGAKETIKDSYGNLIARFEPKNSASDEYIGFVSHADTVKPGVGIEPVIKDGKVVSKGETILGADDKAGIAETIEALLIADKRPPIEIIITRNEEIGTVGSKKLNYDLVKSKKAFVVDLEAPNEVVIGGPTHIFFDVTYIGKSAHAGVEPEKGISAIQAASIAISKMKLGRIDEETTANVGVIKGGEVRNGVPAKCEIMAECRSLDDQKAHQIKEEMIKLFEEGAKQVGAKVEIKTSISSVAYKISPDSEVVKIVADAVKKTGINPDIQVIVGGTDASAFNEHGIPTVALGVGCHNIHTIDEYLNIDEAKTMVKVIANIMESLA